MNVTFHAIGSFAAAAILNLHCDEKRRSFSALIKYTLGFIAGILIHGILDFLPHYYPLPSKFDVIFALVLLFVFLFIARNRNRILILSCFGGAIFPDVLDLSAGIASKYLGTEISLFSFKVFPWHWKEFSGSIYNGSRNLESNIYHSAVLLLSLAVIYAYRKKFLKV